MKDPPSLRELYVLLMFLVPHHSFYTCAEATLQGLQAIWDLPQKGYSWASVGYMGAISTKKTTCGLFIGTSVAKSLNQWVKEKGLKNTCDVYLKFVMNKCVEMAEEGKI